MARVTQSRGSQQSGRGHGKARQQRRRPEGHRRPAGLLAAALAVVAAAGLTCGLVRALADSGSPAPTAKVMLRVGLVNEPDNLDPFIGTSTSSYLIFHLNYDMLTGYKASNVDPSPELARAGATAPTARSGPSTCGRA